jgi:hypothetical protein
MTRDGGGSVAPCLRQSSSHTSPISAMTMIGGTTRAAMSRPIAAARASESFGRRFCRRNTLAMGGSTTRAG